MAERSFAPRSFHRFAEPNEESRSLSRPGPREVFTTAFEHPAVLREMVVETLMKDVQAVEVVPVPGSGYDARIDYPESLKQEVFSLYQAWMEPSFRILANRANERAATGTLSLEGAAIQRRGAEKEIEHALHDPLHGISQVVGGPDEHRWTVDPEAIRTLQDLVRAQVTALRSLLCQRSDWPQRLDLVAHGLARKRRVDTAWEVSMKDPNWLPSMNRVLGFAGASAATLPEPVLKERHLVVAGEALAPASDALSGRLAEENGEARMQGERLRDDLAEYAEKRVEAVRNLADLEGVLRRYVDTLNAGQDAFDLPDVLNWKQAIAHVSQQIVQYETRRGSLEHMIDAWEPGGPPETLETMQASHAALGEEGGRLVLRLRNVREGYKSIGKRLEALAALGIAFDAERPVGLAGLLTLVQGTLREIAIPHPRSVSVT